MEIMIDYDLELEDAVFILIHLFGHTVQWNVSEDARAIGLAQPTGAWTEAALVAVAAYELQACRYSLQLLHDAGVRDLDLWVSEFAACDCAYLMHLYRTGEKRPFREFWREDVPLLPAPLLDSRLPARALARSKRRHGRIGRAAEESANIRTSRDSARSANHRRLAGQGLRQGRDRQPRPRAARSTATRRSTSSARARSKRS